MRFSRSAIVVDSSCGSRRKSRVIRMEQNIGPRMTRKYASLQASFGSVSLRNSQAILPQLNRQAREETRAWRQPTGLAPS